MLTGLCNIHKNYDENITMMWWSNNLEKSFKTFHFFVSRTTSTQHEKIRIQFKIPCRDGKFPRQSSTHMSGSTRMNDVLLWSFICSVESREIKSRSCVLSTHTKSRWLVPASTRSSVRVATQQILSWHLIYLASEQRGCGVGQHAYSREERKVTLNSIK